MFIIILSKEIFVWKNHSNNENNPRIWKNLLHSSPYGKVCGSSFILYKSLSWLLISKYQWDWSTLVQRSSRIGFIYLWTSWDLFSSMSWSWQWANEVLIHTDNITVVVSKWIRALIFLGGFIHNFRTMNIRVDPNWAICKQLRVDWFAWYN